MRLLDGIYSILLAVWCFVLCRLSPAVKYLGWTEARGIVSNHRMSNVWCRNKRQIVCSGEMEAGLGHTTGIQFDWLLIIYIVSSTTNIACQIYSCNT